MKAFCKKLSNSLKTVFGYGVMTSLFAGGLTFFVFIAALFIGGAQVNGSYVDGIVESKDGTAYTFDNTNKSLVATVVDEKFSFGNEAEEEGVVTIGGLKNKESGVYAHLYTIDEEGNAIIVEKPEADVAYKFGIPTKENGVLFVTGKLKEYRMDTTDNHSDAPDVYLRKNDDSYKLYIPIFDENGKPAKDDNGNTKVTYVNMVYSGGTGYEICMFLKENVMPNIIYLSVIMVLLGLVAMYLAGEKALTPEKKESKKHEGEV